jgi:hypothetical protein
LKVLAPKRIAGREVLYVEGENDGKALVRKGGRRASYVTLHLEPTGRMAMRDNLYPVTAFGMENLLVRLLEVAQDDLAHGECTVKTIRGAKIDGRGCTAYEVTHPIRRDYFRFHMARVFIDDELNLPVRFAAYMWPEAAGEPPLLNEEFTFRKLQLNVGFADEDFQRTNPKYGFRDKDER